MLIFDNEFRDHRKFRSGSRADARNVEAAFKPFGFEVHTVLKWSIAELEKRLDKWRKILNASRGLFSTLVVYMASHGSEDGVYGHDGRIFDPMLLSEMFGGTNCPGLAGKPKIFIVNACRGERYNRVVEADGGEC